MKLGHIEYDSKDLLGKGTFGCVYKGRDERNNRTVAIKAIQKVPSNPLLPLAREITILLELKKFDHKNVVQFLDCTIFDGTIYLVLEYCNGGDLARYLKEKETLSEDTIRLFLGQLASAMKVLYNKNIIHRDLKPQNILLSYSGGSAYPPPAEITLKIADFGLSRFLNEGSMAGTECGTLRYMAPEVKMSMPYDAKVDLYSLGVIVFQCSTGRAPTYQNNVVSNIPRSISYELCNLLLGLLTHNATERMSFEAFFNHPFLANESLDLRRSKEMLKVFLEGVNEK